MASYVKRLGADIVEGLIGADFIDGLLSDDVKNAKGLADAAQLRADSAYSRAGSNSSHTHTSNQVGSASSGLSAGSVGSYVFASTYDYSVSAGFGDLVSGSYINPTGIVRTNYDANGGCAFVKGLALSGSWRCMGHTGNYSNWPHKVTLWIRVL